MRKTEVKDADQTCYLSHLHYTDTGTTSSSTADISSLLLLLVFLFVAHLAFSGSSYWCDFCLFVCIYGCVATAHEATFRLRAMPKVEEGYGKNAGEWAGKAD